MEALYLFFVAVVLVMRGHLLPLHGRVRGAAQAGCGPTSRYYYQTRHFISVSGLLYRMKQNAVGLANICILSTMVLVTVSTTASLYLGLRADPQSRCSPSIWRPSSTALPSGSIPRTPGSGAGGAAGGHPGVDRRAAGGLRPGRPTHLSWYTEVRGYGAYQRQHPGIGRETGTRRGVALLDPDGGGLRPRSPGGRRRWRRGRGAGSTARASTCPTPSTIGDRLLPGGGAAGRAGCRRNDATAVVSSGNGEPELVVVVADRRGLIERCSPRPMRELDRSRPAGDCRFPQRPSASRWTWTGSEAEKLDLAADVRRWRMPDESRPCRRQPPGQRQGPLRHVRRLPLPGRIPGASVPAGHGPHHLLQAGLRGL